MWFCSLTLVFLDDYSKTNKNAIFAIMQVITELVLFCNTRHTFKLDMGATGKIDIYFLSPEHDNGF